MELQQYVVVGIFLLTLGTLICSQLRPSRVFSVALLLLLLTGNLSLEQVLANATNTGVITLVLLLLVSNVLDKTGVIKQLGRRLVVKSYSKSFFRLFGVTFVSSALLNNTAVVATLLGPVKHNPHHRASRLLMPLSFFAIFGGTVTLIGTSTNLIVDAFLRQRGEAGFGFFDFTPYGLCAGLGGALMLYLCQGLLPRREVKQKPYKEYVIEARVDNDSPLIGKTIEQSHLRNLPELFLVEIIRGKGLISPVHPEEALYPGDKLIFTGNVKRIDSLGHIEGLSLFAEADGLLKENLQEVVISNRANIVGKSLKQVGFRALFDAAVVALRRDGAEVSGKLGEIKLQPGDYLLLATGPDFAKRHNLNKNFFLLSEHQIGNRLRPWQEALSLGGFVAAIGLAALGWLSLPLALLYLLGLLILTRITDSNEVRRVLPINLLMVIIGALSLASAMQTAGLIQLLTEQLAPGMLSWSPIWALMGVYVITLLMTEMITNNAAAALMFPFAMSIAQALGLPIMPFALAVAFAASASFMSPHGYQTNLLVFSAANYRYLDFIRVGLPVSITYSGIILALLSAAYF